MLVDTSVLFNVLDNYPFLELVKSKESKLLKGACYTGKDFDYYRFLSFLPEREIFLPQGTYAFAEKDEEVYSVYTCLSDLWFCFLLQKNDFIKLFDSVDISGIETPLDVFKLDGTIIVGLAKDCPSRIMIPKGITGIEHYVFRQCDSLTDVTIPSSVTRIGDGAFEDCLSLTDITIPDSVTSIGEAVFYHCTSLKGAIIGNSVTSIEIEAFRNCYSLISVTIGNSVKSIGDRAFSDCSSLTSITIPNSVTSIGNNAFFDCESLKSITFNDTIATWESLYKGSIWNENVPARVIHCTDGDVTL